MGSSAKSIILIFIFIREIYAETPRVTDNTCIVSVHMEAGMKKTNLSCINNVTNLDNINILQFRNSQLLKLPEFVFSSFPHVIKIHLDDSNVLSILNNAFAKNSRLEELYLNENHLTNLLQSGCFNSLKNLRILDLSRSNLTSLNSHIFDNLGQLQILNLSYNNLEDISDLQYFNTENIRFLDYSHNSLTTLESQLLSKFNRLQKLLLNNNKISRLVLDHYFGYTKPELVDASFNQINYINCPDFIEININNNGLSISVNLGDDVIDVSENNLPAFTVASASAKFINASWNSIKALPYTTFRDARDLRVLDVSHNAITKIGFDTFNTLEVLIHLNLSHNQLTELAYGTFDKLVNLETIDISYNKFHYLYETPHEGTFGFCNMIRLREISLRGNPWSKGILNKMYIFKQISSELDQFRNNMVNFDKKSTNESTVVDSGIEKILKVPSSTREPVVVEETSHSLSSSSNPKNIEIAIFAACLLCSRIVLFQ